MIPGFRQTVREFFAYKSNWTGLTMIATAAVAWDMGEITAAAAMAQGFGGLSLLFIRDAIAGGRE